MQRLWWISGKVLLIVYCTTQINLLCHCYIPATPSTHWLQHCFSDYSIFFISDYSICSMIYSVGFMITAFVFWLQHFFFDYNAVSLITTGCARTLWIRYLVIIMKILLKKQMKKLNLILSHDIHKQIIIIITLY